MKFTSTRDTNLRLTAAEVIVRGLSDDGGLFVPIDFPMISNNSFLGKSYLEIATLILGKFLDEDFSADEISEMLHAAYDEALPVQLSVLTENESILELFHGKTAAFKDVALQLLPHLMTAALKKTGEKREAVILTATSGDTGSAVMSGFSNVSNTRVIVFYPKTGISEIQRLQMTTQPAKNVHAVAIHGNFDDAQTAVKKLFQDKEFSAEFEETSFFTSANSINFGRLLPQIVYYFWAYSELVSSKQISVGDPVDFSVPTGNFGNILAGFYAKKMGLPVGKLICATNQNSVLFDFFKTGRYDRNRDFHVTNSPSMDILVSSNFERLIYHMGDETLVRKTQTALEKDGYYTVPAEIFIEISKVFSSYTVNNHATSALIAEAKKDHHYILDPHTAVAYGAASTDRIVTESKNYQLILATASPYKFEETVSAALGYELSATEIPESLSGLTDRTVSQKREIDKANLKMCIQEILTHDKL
ncbi:MAG: threonine synthase [Streptococcaceae bacterium]|jgi:threonine synthase|nr:threonine synthase [Streptococcaceae bacterium]